jgi:DNA-binding transcriptional LysR family regulator
MSVELRHLRALVAIAEEGTLTAAAARLRITQPALSRTLRQLEVRVGTTLVDRSTRHATPTPAGVELCERARAILSAVDEAVAAAATTRRPLRLGYSWAALGRYTAPLLRSWRERYPDDDPVQVHRVEDRTGGLARGLVDVAVIRGEPDDARLAAALRDARLRAQAVATEARLAVLPGGHPLARRRAVTLADLAHEVIASTSYGTTTLDLWPSEHRPKGTLEVNNVDEWLTVIATGAAVGVTPAATRYVHAYPGVRYVPLSDAPPVTVFLIWPRRPSHPRTAAFRAHVAESLPPATSGPAGSARAAGPSRRPRGPRPPATG